MLHYTAKLIKGYNAFDYFFQNPGAKRSLINFSETGKSSDMRIGYACINQTLAAQKIFVNRGMVKRTFEAKGDGYAGELIVKNLSDLIQVLEWNERNNILFYRMSGNMFPWMSEYQIADLPQISVIKELLLVAGKIAERSNQRLTYHPGPFNVLASANEQVVINTIKELNQHAEIMDLMGLSDTTFNKINIHLGTTLQGNKQEAAKMFCRNFVRLGPSARERLTIENDDKLSMYTIEDLYEGVHEYIGIPLVFDFHHHLCHPGKLNQKEALKLALSTWPDKIAPVVHYSEPKSFSDKKLLRAHADYLIRQIPTYGQQFDIMVEAKEKEGAVLRYKEWEENDRLEAPLTTLVV